MTVWSWLKLAVWLWLLRKTVKVGRAAAGGRDRDRGLAAHPGRGGRIPGGVVAGLAARPGCAGPPPGRWPMTAGVAGGRRGAAGRPRRGWPGGRRWPRSGPGSTAGRTRPPWPRPAMFAAARPGHGPGRARPGRRAVGVAELRHHRRLGGITASAPVTFDARQWQRQVRTARGLTDAPGAVPLLAGAGRSRSAAPSAPSATPGTRCSPCPRRVRPAHGHRRRDRVGEDQPDDPAVGGLVHRHPGRRPGRDRGTGRC